MGDLLQLRWKTLQVICQFVFLKRGLNLEVWILSSLATLNRILFWISVLVDICIYPSGIKQSHITSAGCGIWIIAHLSLELSY